MASTRIDIRPALERHLRAANGDDVSRVAVALAPHKTTVTTEATAGVVTYTADQLMGGFILRDPNGSARSDVTPTAALLVAAMPGAFVGQSFETTIRNTADAAETITITAGTDCTLSGTMTIAQNASRRFLVVVTAIGTSPTYTVYSNGSFTS